MSGRSFFFATDGGVLRAPWRIAIFLLAVAACFLAGTAFVLPLLEWLAPHLGLGPIRLDMPVVAIALLGAHGIALRVDRRGWHEVRLDRASASLSRIGTGFFVGALAIGLPVVVLVAAGWERRTVGEPGSVIAAMVRVALLLAPAALVEELLVRGYVFAVLRQAWGAIPTLAVTSVVFGLLHLQNPGATALAITMVTMAGVVLGSVLLVTDSLYAAWAAHFGWNWAMAAIFHVAVSGLPVEAPAYRYVAAGPPWATGGAWGPEGGVPAGVGMLAAIIYLYQRRQRRRER